MEVIKQYLNKAGVKDILVLPMAELDALVNKHAAEVSDHDNFQVDSTLSRMIKDHENASSPAVSEGGTLGIWGARKNIVDADGKLEPEDLAIVVKYAGENSTPAKTEAGYSLVRYDAGSEFAKFMRTKGIAGAYHAPVGGEICILVENGMTPEEEKFAIQHEELEIKWKKALPSSAGNIPKGMDINRAAHILAWGEQIILNDWKTIDNCRFLMGQIEDIKDAARLSSLIDDFYNGSRGRHHQLIHNILKQEPQYRHRNIFKRIVAFERTVARKAIERRRSIFGPASGTEERPGSGSVGGADYSRGELAPPGVIRKSKNSHWYKDAAGFEGVDIEHFVHAQRVLQTLLSDTKTMTARDLRERLVAELGLGSGLSGDAAIKAIYDSLAKAGYSKKIVDIINGYSKYDDPRITEVTVEGQNSDAKTQSVYEAVSNSIDALTPGDKDVQIGQFGKGIKQLLKWLEIPGKDRIDVWTRTKDNPPYHLVIFKGPNGQPYIQVKEISLEAFLAASGKEGPGETGTGAVIRISSTNTIPEDAVTGESAVHTQRNIIEGVRKRYPFVTRLKIFTRYGSGEWAEVNGHKKKTVLLPKDRDVLGKMDETKRIYVSVGEHEIVISDNGIGMGAKTAARMFVPGMSEGKGPVFLDGAGAKEYLPNIEAVHDSKEKIRRVSLARNREVIESFEMPETIIPSAVVDGNLMFDLGLLLDVGESRARVNIHESFMLGLGYAASELAKGDLEPEFKVRYVNSMVIALEAMTRGNSVFESMVRKGIAGMKESLVPVVEELRKKGYVLLPHETDYLELRVPEGKRPLYLSEKLFDWKGRHDLERMGGVLIGSVTKPGMIAGLAVKRRIDIMAVPFAEEIESAMGDPISTIKDYLSNEKFGRVVRGRTFVALPLSVGKLIRDIGAKKKEALSAEEKIILGMCEVMVGIAVAEKVDTLGRMSDSEKEKTELVKGAFTGETTDIDMEAIEWFVDTKPSLSAKKARSRFPDDAGQKLALSSDGRVINLKTGKRWGDDSIKVTELSYLIGGAYKIKYVLVDSAVEMTEIVIYDEMTRDHITLYSSTTEEAGKRCIVTSDKKHIITLGKGASGMVIVIRDLTREGQAREISMLQLPIDNYTLENIAASGFFILRMSGTPEVNPYISVWSIAEEREIKRVSNVPPEVDIKVRRGNGAVGVETASPSRRFLITPESILLEEVHGSAIDGMRIDTAGNYAVFYGADGLMDAYLLGEKKFLLDMIPPAPNAGEHNIVSEVSTIWEDNIPHVRFLVRTKDSRGWVQKQAAYVIKSGKAEKLNVTWHNEGLSERTSEWNKGALGRIIYYADQNRETELKVGNEQVASGRLAESYKVCGSLLFVYNFGVKLGVVDISTGCRLKLEKWGLISGYNPEAAVLKLEVKPAGTPGGMKVDRKLMVADVKPGSAQGKEIDLTDPSLWRTLGEEPETGSIGDHIYYVYKAEEGPGKGNWGITAVSGPSGTFKTSVTGIDRGKFSVCKFDEKYIIFIDPDTLESVYFDPVTNRETHAALPAAAVPNKLVLTERPPEIPPKITRIPTPDGKFRVRDFSLSPEADLNYKHVFDEVWNVSDDCVLAKTGSGVYMIKMSGSSVQVTGSDSIAGVTGTNFKVISANKNFAVLEVDGRQVLWDMERQEFKQGKTSNKCGYSISGDYAAVISGEEMYIYRPDDKKASIVMDGVKDMRFDENSDFMIIDRETQDEGRFTTVLNLRSNSSAKVKELDRSAGHPVYIDRTGLFVIVKEKKSKVYNAVTMEPICDIEADRVGVYYADDGVYFQLLSGSDPDNMNEASFRGEFFKLNNDATVEHAVSDKIKGVKAHKTLSGGSLYLMTKNNDGTLSAKHAEDVEITEGYLLTAERGTRRREREIRFVEVERVDTTGETPLKFYHWETQKRDHLKGAKVWYATYGAGKCRVVAVPEGIPGGPEKSEISEMQAGPAASFFVNGSKTALIHNDMVIYEDGTCAKWKVKLTGRAANVDTFVPIGASGDNFIFFDTAAEKEMYVHADFFRGQDTGEVSEEIPAKWVEQVAPVLGDRVKLAQSGYDHILGMLESRVPDECIPAVRNLFKQEVEGLYNQQEAPAILEAFSALGEDLPFNWSDNMPIDKFIGKARVLSPVLGEFLKTVGKELSGEDEALVYQFYMNLFNGIIRALFNKDIVFEKGIFDEKEAALDILRSFGLGWKPADQHQLDDAGVVGGFMNTLVSNSDAPADLGTRMKLMSFLSYISLMNREKHDIVVRQARRMDTIAVSGNNGRNILGKLSSAFADPSLTTAALINSLNKGIYDKLGNARPFVIFFSNDAPLVRDDIRRVPAGRDVAMPGKGVSITQIKLFNSSGAWQEGSKEVKDDALMDIEDLIKHINDLPELSDEMKGKEKQLMNDIRNQRESGAYTGEIAQNSKDATKGVKDAKLVVDFYLQKNGDITEFVEEAADNGTGALKEVALLIDKSTKDEGGQVGTAGFFGTGKFTIFEGVNRVEIITKTEARAFMFTFEVQQDDRGNPIGVMLKGIRRVEDDSVSVGVTVRRIKTADETIPELDMMIAQRSWKVFAGCSQLYGNNNKGRSFRIFFRDTERKEIPLDITCMDKDGKRKVMDVEKDAIAEGVFHPAVKEGDEEVPMMRLLSAEDMPRQIVDRAGLRVCELKPEYLELIPKALRDKHIEELGLIIQIPLPLIRERNNFKDETAFRDAIKRYIATEFYRAMAKKTLTQNDPRFFFEGYPSEDWDENTKKQYWIMDDKILGLAAKISKQDYANITSEDLRSLIPLEGKIDKFQRYVSLILALEIDTGRVDETGASLKDSLLLRRAAFQQKINPGEVREQLAKMKGSGLSGRPHEVSTYTGFEAKMSLARVYAECGKFNTEENIIKASEYDDFDREMIRLAEPVAKFFGMAQVFLVPENAPYNGQFTYVADAPAMILSRRLINKKMALGEWDRREAVFTIIHELAHFLEGLWGSSSDFEELMRSGITTDNKPAGYTHAPIGPFAEAMKYVAAAWLNLLNSGVKDVPLTDLRALSWKIWAERGVSATDKKTVPAVKPSTVKSGDLVSERQALSAVFLADDNGKDADVITVVGVPAGFEYDAEIGKLIPKLSSGLRKNLGKDKQAKMIITFQIDGDFTADNQEKAMRSALKHLEPGGSIVLFSPQGLAKDAKKDYEDKKYPDEISVTVVSDAYTDSDIDPKLEKKKFPDIMSRVALARHIAFWYRTKTQAGKDDTFDAIKDFLSKIAANDFSTFEGKDLPELLHVLLEEGLKIKAIEYGDIVEWQEAQEAVAVSL
ncbi:MAG: hypothetical protein HQL30_11025 [Candidatus Omnitrophica bacterium]|nr:hypothetical protein [Candidatus Omnitrophota bacterium]